MSKEFDAALKDVNDLIRNMVKVAEDDPPPTLGAALIVGGAILSGARLLAVAIRDTGLAADDKWQPPTIEQALGPGG